MRIENYIHTTPEEIDSRRWNPYLATRFEFGGKVVVTSVVELLPYRFKL